MSEQTPTPFKSTYNAETEYKLEVQGDHGSWPIWRKYTDGTEANRAAIQLAGYSKSAVRIIKRTVITTEEQYWPTPMCSHEGCQKYAAPSWRTCPQHIGDCF